ncbi:YdcF family protein [Clostridium nigeriense]|uniref:YdcF family protein n=1 Tax=Clostridium nigeriense TaxID=1805470 RepID=UPI0008376DBA|nr:YdcF family protein [Clostridium nigeriense]
MKKYINIILGIIMILYVIIINLIFGKITFSEFFLVIGILFIIYHFIKNKASKIISKNRKIKAVVNIFRFLISIGIIIFIVIEAIIIVFPKNNDAYSSYIIILGAGVKGETPSLTLSERLEKSIDYINSQNKDIKIIVSGGKGKGEDISEAEAMKRYLLKSGIKEEIIKEDKSTNTRENLMFSKEILENITHKDIEDIDVKIITSDFHAFRSNLIAKSLDYEKSNFLTNRTLPLLMPVMYSREFFAIGKYFLIEIIQKIY